MKGRFKLCLAIINADTESTTEGYMSAFIAKRCETRLQIRAVGGNTDYIPEIVNSMNYTVRTTQQADVKTYFDQLQKIAENVKEYVIQKEPKYDADKIDVYYIVQFANQQWDLEVLKGVLFHDTPYEMGCVGEAADLVELKWGFIRFHDFLRLTGFRSIKMAGLVCFNAHKLDGDEVYAMKLADVPKNYEDYSETKKQYIENDVDVMNESLNIILNRKENLSMQYTHELPSTATGFSRWRMSHNEKVICYDGEKHSVYTIVNNLWKHVRPFLAFFMRAYKGGLSGVHPISQYKLLSNILCVDAVSMYPHKMLFFRMMQPHYSGKVYETDEPIEKDETAAKLWKNILDYSAAVREDGLPLSAPDRSDTGIKPWVGEVEISIYGLNRNEHAMMLPCLSKYKIEMNNAEIKKAEANHSMITANGKILQCSHVTIITTSVDLYLLNLCYDMDVHAIRTVVYMQWQYMDFVQKRDVWEAYKRKQHISAVADRAQNENDDYWTEEAGFNANAINRMAADEYRVFLKQYKQMIKADVNGKYGLTVECPIHAETEVDKTEEGLFEIGVTESVMEKCIKLINNPEEAPEHVKNNDYCAGSSITMWARWHLILLAHYLFEHGSQTHYTDTDSLFIDNTVENVRLVGVFNAWMKDNFHTCFLSDEDEEQINYAETGGLGMMKRDKVCKYFRAMGAKCYAYIDEKDRPHVTVAGLNASNYTYWMQKQMEKGEPVQGMLLKYFTPNVFIEPSGTKKLLITKSNEGFDENGLWRGPILQPIGFQLVNTCSAFHVHNMRIAGFLQGKGEMYYVGRYTSSSALYVTDKGILTREDYEKLKMEGEGTLYDFFDLAIEDQQPIKGGMLRNAQPICKA